MFFLVFIDFLFYFSILIFSSVFRWSFVFTFLILMAGCLPSSPAPCICHPRTGNQPNKGGLWNIFQNIKYTKRWWQQQNHNMICNKIVVFPQIGGQSDRGGSWDKIGPGWNNSSQTFCKREQIRVRVSSSFIPTATDCQLVQVRDTTRRRRIIPNDNDGAKRPKRPPAKSPFSQ